VPTHNYADELKKHLADDRLHLLHRVADDANALGFPFYLIGGSVRDLLLGSPIKDLDLAVEGDAIQLAHSLAKKHGGAVTQHSRFFTATWSVNESTDIDLTSTRKETYPFPGALPTVEKSNIEEDIRRRDFTINAMAIRLDGDHFGELVDPLNGQKDLEDKLIHVLHDKSFVDDPTRMFRAVRYAMRYGFQIEAGTRAMFNDEAKAVVAQLSGERLRYEFDLIFEEEKPMPMLAALKDLDIIKVIHPALENANVTALSYMKDVPGNFGEFVVPEILTFRQTLGWLLYLMSLPSNDIDALAGRLAFPVLLTKASHSASLLNSDLVSFKHWKPSQWTFHLDELPSLAVYAVWMFRSVEPLNEYLTKWQKVKPFTTGDTLKQLGLEPGPRYKLTLNRLRAAWLDGEVKSEKEELDLLRSILVKN